jgi:hypothetical protein
MIEREDYSDVTFGQILELKPLFLYHSHKVVKEKIGFVVDFFNTRSAPVALFSGLCF